MKNRNDFYSNKLKPPITNLNSPFDQDRELIKKLADDKIKLHNTMFANFIGVPTKITYFNQIAETNKENMRNNSTNSTIASEIKYYKKINNLEVRIEDSISLSNEGEDVAKSYIRSGNMKILPDTITPYPGDYFVLEYLNNIWLFQVNTVNKEAIELNSGFILEFEIANNGEFFDYDSWNLKDRIKEEEFFQAAHFGTDYKTMLSKKDVDYLESIKDFYNFLGRVYVSYFYDKRLNVYLLKNIYRHDPLQTQDIKNRQTNNNIYDSETYYDNFLNYFIRSNNIFNNIDGKIITPSTLAGFEDLDYISSIFSAITKKEKDMLKYTFTNSEHVNSCSIYIPTTLFGLEYVKHVSYDNNLTVQLFPVNFFEDILNFNFYNLTDFSKREYNSDTNLITETIAIYLCKVTKADEFNKLEELNKRLFYLYNRKNKLLIDNIYPQHIFYLYPLLSYIVIDVLKTKFNK